MKKSKIQISLIEQDEWEDYFNTHKSNYILLKTEVNKTDREIDQMVYQLYGLTEEEKQIVENSI